MPAAGNEATGQVAAKPKHRLAAVLDPTMLGVTPAFFDKKAGEPERATEDQNTYMIDGCSVIAHLKGQSVESIELLVSPACRADLSNLTSQGSTLEVSDQLTFGQFEERVGQAQYKTTCLSMCGNAYEPTSDAVIPGNHSSGFIDIVAMTVSGLDAREKWREAMAAKGEDYVAQARFNCDRQFDPVARQAFAKEKVGSVRFGHGLDEYSCE